MGVVDARSAHRVVHAHPTRVVGIDHGRVPLREVFYLRIAEVEELHYLEQNRKHYKPYVTIHHQFPIKTVEEPDLA